MAEILVLRLVHVLGGLFWVGAALFSGFFLMPAMQNAGPAAGALMEGMKRRRLFVVMPTVAVLTILSGLRLMWITSGGFAPAYFTSSSGFTYAAAGGAAIVAFVLGITLAMPTGKRMATVGQSIAAASDETARASLLVEMARLQRRSTLLGRVVTALLILAAAGMAIGRYV